MDFYLLHVRFNNFTRKPLDPKTTLPDLSSLSIRKQSSALQDPQASTVAGYPAVPSTPPPKGYSSFSGGNNEPIQPAAPRKSDKQWAPARAAQRERQALAAFVKYRRVIGSRVAKPEPSRRPSAMSSMTLKRDSSRVPFADELNSPSPAPRPFALLPKNSKNDARRDSFADEPTTPKQMAPTKIPAAPHYCDTLCANGCCSRCAGSSRGNAVDIADTQTTSKPMPTPAIPTTPLVCDTLNAHSDCTKCAGSLRGTTMTLPIRTNNFTTESSTVDYTTAKPTLDRFMAITKSTTTRSGTAAGKAQSSKKTYEGC